MTNKEPPTGHRAKHSARGEGSGGVGGVCVCEGGRGGSDKKRCLHIDSLLVFSSPSSIRCRFLFLNVFHQVNSRFGSILIQQLKKKNNIFFCTLDTCPLHCISIYRKLFFFPPKNRGGAREKQARLMPPKRGSDWDHGREAGKRLLVTGAGKQISSQCEPTTRLKG